MNKNKEIDYCNIRVKIEPEKELLLNGYQLNNDVKYNPDDFLYLWNTHSMLSSKELDMLEDRVKSPKLPEMLFGYNRFYIIFPSKYNIIYEVSPIDAIDYSVYDIRDKLYVDLSNPFKDSKDINITTDKKTIHKKNNESNSSLVNCIYHIPNEYKIQFYEKWKNLKVPEKTDVQESTATSDWSFSSAYMGSFNNLSNHNLYLQHLEGNYKILSIYDNKLNSQKNKTKIIRTLTNEQIPLDRLSQSNTVLKYWQIPLFDDELNDNGLSMSNFRFRIMKDCFFGLLRHYLRVDNVVVRIMDTRIFHSYGDNYVLRDFQVKEATYNELTDKGFLINSEWSLSDHQSDMVYPYLNEKFHINDKIEFIIDN